MVRTRGKITAINPGKNPRTRRSNIYLDGKFAFSLDNEVIVRENLRVGLELNPDIVRKLNMADQYQKCLNAAFSFLAFRPRSEIEIRQRLQRRGFESADIEKVISELKRLDLINDASFAEFWKDNRNSFRPRSQRMVKYELRRKGVETAVIDQIVEDIDDQDNAYRAAIVKARTIPVTDYNLFRQRLGSFLQRRGFSYGVVKNVVKQAWMERTSNTNPEPESPDETDEN